MIPESQLLVKYGGTLETPPSLWPVPNTLTKEAYPINTKMAEMENNNPINEWKFSPNILHDKPRELEYNDLMDLPSPICSNQKEPSNEIMKFPRNIGMSKDESFYSFFNEEKDKKINEELQGYKEDEPEMSIDYEPIPALKNKMSGWGLSESFKLYEPALRFQGLKRSTTPDLKGQIDSMTEIKGFKVNNPQTIFEEKEGSSFKKRQETLNGLRNSAGIQESQSSRGSDYLVSEKWNSNISNQNSSRGGNDQRNRQSEEDWPDIETFRFFQTKTIRKRRGIKRQTQRFVREASLHLFKKRKTGDECSRIGSSEEKLDLKEEEKSSLPVPAPVDLSGSCDILDVAMAQPEPSEIYRNNGHETSTNGILEASFLKSVELNEEESPELSQENRRKPMKSARLTSFQSICIESFHEMSSQEEMDYGDEDIPDEREEITRNKNKRFSGHYEIPHFLTSHRGLIESCHNLTESTKNYDESCFCEKDTQEREEKDFSKSIPSFPKSESAHLFDQTKRPPSPFSSRRLQQLKQNVSSKEKSEETCKIF